MSEPQLRQLLAEQAGILIEQRDSVDAATAALVDVTAELRAGREAGVARDERLERLLAAQERFLGMVEAHQAHLEEHEERLDRHEERIADHEGAIEALTQGQVEAQVAQAEAAEQIASLASEVSAVRAARLAGWRLVAVVVALVTAGGGIALIGVLAGAAWAGVP